MSLEDGAALGLCLSRLTNKSPEDKRHALAVYEACRRDRTERVVARGSLQQYLYHLHDGPEQEARDARLRAFGAKDEATLSTGAVAGLPDGYTKEEDPLAWRTNGVGSWLLEYDVAADVEAKWNSATSIADRWRGAKQVEASTLPPGLVQETTKMKGGGIKLKSAVMEQSLL